MHINHTRMATTSMLMNPMQALQFLLLGSLAISTETWAFGKYKCQALASQHTLDLLANPMLLEITYLQLWYQSETEAGDNGNFKPSIYNAAAQHISQHPTSGPAKTGAMVKNKWISHIQKIYQDIEECQGKSGCHWDNICGAGVQGKFDEQVFENYAKNHLLIWPFKNSGWEYYELMLNIMPNGISCGNNTFTLGASTFPTGAAHHVTDHSPALNGETALDTPDQLGCSLNINEWCEMLPRDDPPHPMSQSICTPSLQCPTI
ncbi:hypothetical protein EDC04DRAFT_2607089 [Pisolithus marmoratus]|nr:hypothetical protein EDC04DRAFT_2607089 [Pisolithus marmoratus]